LVLAVGANHHRGQQKVGKGHGAAAQIAGTHQGLRIDDELVVMVFVSGWKYLCDGGGVLW